MTGGTRTQLHIAILFLPLLASCVAARGTVSPPSTKQRTDPDLPRLVAYLRNDLAFANANEQMDASIVRRKTIEAEKAAAIVLSSLRVPVAGVWPDELEDNFGAPRDGGVRSHRGIDIFAPRGTKVVAVADGTITYIGEQKKGGRCFWLTTDAGVSFYYAHLDRWISGLQEGMRVRKGALLGYVGNTGNAKNTAPHLHFQVVDRSQLLNPWPLLQQARGSYDTAPVLTGGFGR